MGGTATVMRAAANLNVRAGLVDREINDPTKVSAAQGVSVTQTDVPGRLIFTESVDGRTGTTFTTSYHFSFFIFLLSYRIELISIRLKIF